MIAALLQILPWIAAPLEVPPPEEQEFISPMLLWAAYMLVAVVLIIVAVAIVAVAATILAGLGIASTSALIGIFHGRFASAVRAFHYQGLAVAGLVVSTGSLWCWNAFTRHHLSPPWILVIGSTTGIAAGLLFAFTVERLARVIYGRWRARIPGQGT